MLKYRAVKKKEVSEEVSEKYLDFDAVRRRLEINSIPAKIRYRTPYKWAVAASFIMLFSIIVYAILNKQKIIKKPSTNPNHNKQVMILPEVSTYILPIAENTLITTQDGLQLLVEHDILEEDNRTDSATVMVSPCIFVKDNSKEYYFYIKYKKAEKASGNHGIILKNPITDLFGVQLFFGGNLPQHGDWVPISITEDVEEFIAKPTQAMLKYEKFIESKNLLDSITKWYNLDNGFYQLKNKKGFRYNKNFIDKLQKTATAYRNENQFDSLSLAAKRSWEIYRRQHKLQIGKKSSEFKRTQSTKKIILATEGWYKVLED